MLVRKIVIAVVFLQILGIAKCVDAQGILPGSKTIGEQLDGVGRSIIGLFGEDTSDKDSTKHKAVKPSSEKEKQNSAQVQNDNPASQGMTIVKPLKTSQQKIDSEPSRPIRVYQSDSHTSSSDVSTYKQIIVTPKKRSSDESSNSSDQDNLSSKPLHERFNQFRRSVFDDHPKSAVVEGSISADSEPDQAVKNKTAPNSKGRPTPAKRPAGMESSDQPVIAERISPKIQINDTIIDQEQSTAKRSVVKSAPKEAEKKLPSLETPAANENGILFARKSPVISVETLGPRKIAVGKESVYEVKIINSGEVVAEDLIVFVNLPEWADVIGSESSTGTPQAVAADQVPPAFQWKINHLQPKSQEKLILRIVPRQSRPFDLAVRWEYKPIASQTMIEVQEPKLEMHLEGPREVYYGKKEMYRLKIINTGTGDAESVVIKLVPVGAGENLPANYELGLLPAGQDKLIEVELTAHQSGLLEIHVEAKGDAGVHAELAEKVLVRRAALEIAMEGPKLQFIGTTAAYVVRVRNSGNAPAKNINFTAALPAGLKYLAGIEGARMDSASNKLLWTEDTIEPETAHTFVIKCSPSAAGVSRVQVSASADDDLTASAIAVTQVESVANLALDVKDPGGPVPVGEETIYEIRVRNRGTKDAEGIELIGYFSRGIEPTSAEGVANRLGPGQVVFEPIATLAAGSEKVLKIHARAEAPGNHIFRAEMHCKPLAARLVSEQVTLYYQDALAIPQPLQARPVSEQTTR